MSLNLLCRPIRASRAMQPAARMLVRPFSSSRAAQVAKMTIVGRLAAEPELQATSTGTDIVKYAIGTSYGPKDNRQTSWFKVTSFEQEGPRRDFVLGLQKG